MIDAPNVEDRRKLKVMLWGTLVGITPAIVIGIPYDLLHQRNSLLAGFHPGAFSCFCCRLSFAYAVVKHRVMDIPVLLRRSARYFLVERGFAILMLVISVGSRLVWAGVSRTHFSAGSKAAIPMGATFGMLLITGATQVHRRVRTRLDRAFFRSAYDAQQILENLAAKALTSASREGLAELLHDADSRRAASACHCSFTCNPATGSCTRMPVIRRRSHDAFDQRALEWLGLLDAASRWN